MSDVTSSAESPNTNHENEASLLEGHSPVVDYGEEIKIPQFSALPSPLQFESAIDSARKLALADQESKAYDRFLFGGDGVVSDSAYEFPAEKLITERMELESARAAALGKRDLLKGLVQKLALEVKHDQAAHQRQDLEGKIERLQTERDMHGSRLDGTSLDSDGTNWVGVRKNPGHLLRTRWALWSPTITLLFVAVVDMLVLMMSLASFIGNDWEGIAFSIPALGIQVFFPHLAGEKIGKFVRGRRPSKFDYWTTSLLIGIWLTFAYLIANVRLLFLNSDGQSKLTGLSGSELRVRQAELAANLDFALPITLAIIVGLGVWLIFAGLKNNPHELAYLRLGVEIEKLMRSLSTAQVRESEARARVELQARAVNLLERNVVEHVAEISEKYAKVSISAYRRRLINSFGEPDFTTAATKGVADVNPR